MSKTKIYVTNDKGIFQSIQKNNNNNKLTKNISSII